MEGEREEEKEEEEEEEEVVSPSSCPMTRHSFSFLVGVQSLLLYWRSTFIVTRRGE